MSSQWNSKALLELRVMKLIAAGIDVRRCRPNGKLAKLPSFKRALAAIDQLRSDVGWRETEGKSEVRRGKRP
jgi:hypothetical protein